VFGWGQNDFGQLGTGDEDARPLPTLAAVPYEAFIADIAAGNEFGMARTKKGELWTWGRMQASNWPRLFADSWCNGYESKGEKGIKGLKVEQMSAGEMHCAVIASGKLFTWGYNDYGQLGWGLHGKDRTGQQKPHEVALEGQTPARVACGGAHTLACGGAHTLCVTAEGKVFGWGSNVMGQLNHGLRDVFPQPMEIAVSEPMAEVFAGRCSSVAIAKSRFAQIWGRMQAEDPTAPTEGEGKEAKAGGPARTRRPGATRPRPRPRRPARAGTPPRPPPRPPRCPASRTSRRTWTARRSTPRSARRTASSRWPTVPLSAGVTIPCSKRRVKSHFLAAHTGDDGWTCSPRLMRGCAEHCPDHSLSRRFAGPCAASRLLSSVYSQWGIEWGSKSSSSACCATARTAAGCAADSAASAAL